MFTSAVVENAVKANNVQDVNEAKQGRMLLTALLISVWLIWSYIKLQKVNSIGYIFIAGGGQFKIAKMIENTGIDLSALNQISDVEIDNNLQSLMSLEEVVTREDASESFEALEN